MRGFPGSQRNAVRLCLENQTIQTNSKTFSLQLLYYSHLIGNERMDHMLLLLAILPHGPYCVSSFCLPAHFQRKFLLLSPSQLKAHPHSCLLNLSLPLSKWFGCSPASIQGPQDRIYHPTRIPDMKQ